MILSAPFGGGFFVFAEIFKINAKRHHSRGLSMKGFFASEVSKMPFPRATYEK